MANYATLISTINNAIKTNGNQEITGQMLQTILDGMVASLGTGYNYMGVATPSTNPGTPDPNVFYLASQAGTYTNFGGLVVNEGEVCALVYNGSWSKQVTGAATAAVVKPIVDELNLARPLFVEKSVITDFSGYTLYNYIIVSGGNYGSSSSNKHTAIPVKPGQRVRVLSNAINGTRIGFFWDLDIPSSGVATPYVAINGEPNVLIPANTEAFFDVPHGARYLIVAIGSSSTNYTPQSVSILESKEQTAEEQMFTKNEYEGENIENPDAIRIGWSQSSQNGLLQKVNSTTKGVTDYIPVKGGNMVCRNATTSGTYGGHCVFDQNYNFIRGWTGTNGTYTYQDGDYYVRFLVEKTGSQPIITRSTYDTYRSGATYVAPLIQKVLKDNTIIMNKAQVPDIYPASSLVGEPGKVVTADSLANGSLTISGTPWKLKPNVSLSFFGKITSFGYVEIGQGYTTALGWGLRITGTNVVAVGYNNGSAYSIETKAHGLTIGTFIYVSIIKEGKDINVKLTSFGGEYVGRVSINFLESYGAPFAYADSSTSLTAIKFGWTAKDLRKPIWFIGASYCSLYEKRMLYQLRETYGIDNFAIIAEAGNDFEAIWSNIINALNYGTPKYLVQGIGMNETYPQIYNYYFKQLENICRQRGIVLVPCTIPWPENGTKEAINNIVKNSGYRYIDLYSAVSSDNSGTWYTGYCDDGVHPTVIGAKAMAAQIMLDLPEILQY